MSPTTIPAAPPCAPWCWLEDHRLAPDRWDHVTDWSGEAAKHCKRVVFGHDIRSVLDIVVTRVAMWDPESGLQAEDRVSLDLHDDHMTAAEAVRVSGLLLEAARLID